MNFKSVVKESLGMMYYHTFKKFQNIRGNRSLIYHAFGTKLEHDTYGISIKIQNFKEHMKYLVDNYKIISNEDTNRYKILIDPDFALYEGNKRLLTFASDNQQVKTIVEFFQ